MDLSHYQTPNGFTLFYHVVYGICLVGFMAGGFTVDGDKMLKFLLLTYTNLHFLTAHKAASTTHKMGSVVTDCSSQFDSIKDEIFCTWETSDYNMKIKVSKELQNGWTHTHWEKKRNASKIAPMWTWPYNMAQDEQNNEMLFVTRGVLCANSHWRLHHLMK